MLQFVNPPIAIPLRLMAGVKSLFKSPRLRSTFCQRLTGLIDFLVRRVRSLLQFFELSFQPFVAIRHLCNERLELRAISIEIVAFVFAAIERPS